VGGKFSIRTIFKCAFNYLVSIRQQNSSKEEAISHQIIVYMHSKTSIIIFEVKIEK